MAAVTLATSCSKDDENQDIAIPNNNEQIENSELIPFSINVVTDNKLSKDGAFSEDNKKNIKIAFADADVNVLKMTLQSSVNFSEVAYLTLTNINGTFEGDIPASWVGQTIKATVGLMNGSAISSDISLLDLMGKCNHPLAGEFKAGVNSSVTLTDQNAYFEIKMSPLQHKLDVTINGSAKTVDLSNDGKVWVAVNTSSYSFADFTTNFYTKAKTNIKPGQIYTINREGFVDLGLSDGTLWADKNVGATTYDGIGDYKTFNEAIALGLTLPEYDEDEATGDFRTLWDEGEFFPEYDENDKLIGITFFKKKNGMYDKNKDPYIFLPAGSLQIDNTSMATVYPGGFYWTQTESGTFYQQAHRLWFYKDSNNNIEFGYEDEDNKTYQQNVRAIRRK